MKLQWPERPFRLRRAQPATLGGYVAGEIWRRYWFIVAVVYLAALAGASAALAYAGPYALMPLATPVAVLLLLIVWVLPEGRRAPVAGIAPLFFGFLIALIVWPDYLAVDIAGLPWITALRLFAVPLVITFLACLSVSPTFRQSLHDVLRVAPATWRFVAMFAVIATVTVLFSADPGGSANKLSVAILNWILIFFVAAYVCSQPGTLSKLAGLAWFGAVIVCLIGLREWQLQAIPWAGSIPSFLTVDDPVLETILSAKTRAFVGEYRLKSKFTTPLGFAEYLAMATPFVLYFVLFARNVFVRGAAFMTLPLIFLSLVRTDSRLGFVGFFMSFLLMLGAWGILRWARHKDSIFGPAITLAFPAVAGVFLLATFFVGRLRIMVWGSGAHRASSMAREDQVAQGMPLIWSQPWGRGIGRGAAELGFRNPAGSLTIDSYYLSAALEFGVLGFLAFFGIFLSSLAYGLKGLTKGPDGERLILIPVLSSIAIFVVVKSVFSQQEHHPLAFMLAGATVGCYYQIRKYHSDKVA